MTNIKRSFKTYSGTYLFITMTILVLWFILITNWSGEDAPFKAIFYGILVIISLFFIRFVFIEERLVEKRTKVEEIKQEIGEEYQVVSTKGNIYHIQSGNKIYKVVFSEGRDKVETIKQGNKTLYHRGHEQLINEIKQILKVEEFEIKQDLNKNEMMVIEVNGTEYEVYTVEYTVGYMVGYTVACILDGSKLVYTSMVKRKSDSRIKFEAGRVKV